MRDWELVQYKYANFNLLESECPESSGPHRPASAGAFPSAGSIPPGHSAFCLFFSLSLEFLLFFFDNPPVRFYFSFYHVVIAKWWSFDLFYNSSGHYPKVILVCISFKCPSEMPIFSTHYAASF